MHHMDTDDLDKPLLPGDDTACPNIAMVSVVWTRDLSLLINPAFDAHLAQPPVVEQQRKAHC